MRTALIIAALLLVVPAVAAADVPVHPPRTAAKLTSVIVQSATWERAFAERHDTDRWPDGARITVNAPDCRVKDRRHGSCTYDIDSFGDAGHKVCGRRVLVRITKATHRVKSRVKSLGCETT